MLIPGEDVQVPKLFRWFIAMELHFFSIPEFPKGSFGPDSSGRFLSLPMTNFYMPITEISSKEWRSGELITQKTIGTCDQIDEVDDSSNAIAHIPKCDKIWRAERLPSKGSR